jgi:hypothetical protein
MRGKAMIGHGGAPNKARQLKRDCEAGRTLEIDTRRK